MSSIYKKSGVDIEAGDSLVDWLKKTAPKSFPHQDRVCAGIGGFASLFRIDFPEMKEPCLVSSTDGVGTKLKLAVHYQKFDSIGQDLVAMCVNDLICCGATPLFFLDYYATGQLRLEEAKTFLDGVRRACTEAQVALIGGETAEMPGVYREGDFDCAGFSVGVVDRSKALGSQRVKEGDVLLGIASSGFHSNGYSLLRKVFAEDLADYKKELMTPTALYVDLALKVRDRTHAFANITGGGVDNILRVIPKGMSVELNDWQWPEIYQEILRRSQGTRAEILQTLNCGLGFVLILPQENWDSVSQDIQSLGYRTFPLGQVQKTSDESGKPYFSNWEELTSQG